MQGLYPIIRRKRRPLVDAEPTVAAVVEATVAKPEVSIPATEPEPSLAPPVETLVAAAQPVAVRKGKAREKRHV